MEPRGRMAHSRNLAVVGRGNPMRSMVLKTVDALFPKMCARPHLARGQQAAHSGVSSNESARK